MIEARYQVFAARSSLSSDPIFLFSPEHFAADPAVMAAYSAGSAAAPVDENVPASADESAASAGVVDSVAALAGAAAANDLDPETAGNAVKSAIDADLAVPKELAASALVRLPLWLQGAPDCVVRMWDNLSQDLTARQVHWRVWTARLRGEAPAAAAVERAQVMVEGSFWVQRALQRFLTRWDTSSPGFAL